jgi:uncharacterized protein
MGHRNSSATFGGGGALRASGDGTRASAPRTPAESVTRGARALLLLLRVYQSFFSALMPSACKFYPSCSHYAADAVTIHGARRGAWLAFRRVMRCHPFTRGGVDLVPEASDFSQNKMRAGSKTILEDSSEEAGS